MEPEHDLGEEGADHGGADAATTVARVTDQVVDTGRRPVDAQRPPRLALLGLLGRRVALDPAHVGPVHGRDPVLGGIGGSRAVVPHDALPGNVVAFPPPDDAGLVEPVVQHR
jgi:hypothetical protein